MRDPATALDDAPFVTARRVVFGIALASYVLSFFHRTAPAAIAGELTRAFEIGGAVLGTLAATYFYVYTILQVPVGVLADTLGPRRILATGSLIAGIGSQRFPYRVGAPGEHYVKNSLAVLAVLFALSADAMRRLPALARIAAPAGRGARTVLEAPDGRILLIDESYNANPASVKAALSAMATTPRAEYPHRVAVLGDMLELGQASADLHRGLKEAIDAAGIDQERLPDHTGIAQRGHEAAQVKAEIVDPRNPVRVDVAGKQEVLIEQLDAVPGEIE